MKTRFSRLNISILAAAALLGVPVAALAAPFFSGSICASSPSDPLCLGAFTTTVDTVINLPPDGILQYTTFTVPANVTVSFKKNAANTPVTILASGDVTIVGTVSVNAQTAPTNTGTYGDGVLGDDGRPGTGGPGGFDGGPGGLGPVLGGTDGGSGGGGQGPGGGQTPVGRYSDGRGYSGGGGGYNGAGAGGWTSTAGGSAYGQASLLPLIGGSGGGGGSAGATFSGAGGAGGGGAILIATSGTFYITGYIVADGGAGGNGSGTYCGGSGGGGTGGAIRVIAETLNRGGAGYLYARGGGGGGGCAGNGGAGAAGYIKLESNTITNWSTGYSNPAYSYSLPGKVFVPNNPTLTIASVNGITVPANPTGVADITLPSGTGAVPVVVNATNVPINTAVKIYLVQTNGVRSEVSPSPALGGTDASSTATSSVTFLPGNTTIMASVTYTVTELIVASLPRFNGEAVARIRVESELGGKSKTIYITASGKEYPADGVQLKKVAS